MRATALLLLLAPVTVSAADIDHAGIGCVVADRFPRLEAKLTPPDGIARARVAFRPENGKHWYSVPMKREGDVYAGVLPRPRPQLPGLRYYIEVTDEAVQTTRTPEYTAVVASGPVACQDKKVASGLATASVTLEVPAGAPAIPAGFSSTGITAGVAGAVAAGAVAAGAAGAAAAGGGVSTALLVGGGVVAAGAAVAVTGVAGGGGGGGDEGSCCARPTGYSVQFVPGPPGIDMSACAGQPVTWSSQRVNATNGAFDETWAPNEPNTARVVGTVTETTFTATLTCIPRPISGTLNATGSGGNYQGEWTFGSARGTLQVVRSTD